ncbi:nucleoside triphosphate pyrophosphohydrolase family protein [Pseudooceanicola marinus]|uniref:nucleoside triphosphate pyrophosphohydrolase family protein n=1 Tax=Pseudooceanicola marinus TaxID=396013 RepID=UPI001CD26CC4|nr:nucleoside triphosphate pyrophosphohydrolase family protein [Pseudooceanicola marinus]MCA1337932.1 nucleoside triphosphate pyrophosphohydrolase family protein [Pseudooceanicola marinus]
MKPFTIAEYQAEAQKTDQRRSDELGLDFHLLGLFGETGSLLSEVKKKQRDPIAYLGYKDSVVEELGDVLWYLTALACRARLGLDELAINLDRSLADWQSTGFTELSFVAIEAPAAEVSTSPTPAFEQTLLKLAGEVGLLMTDHAAGRLERNRSALKGRLIGVLRALRAAAHEAGITLEDAAKANLEKTFDRWPVERHYPPLFDEAFPVHEQLPRQLVIDIEEVELNGRTMARLTCDGKPVGDPLTDNRDDDDDYRFHDVFHLSYAAHLGWSPTLRRLLRVKRKSDPRMDEVQDGARAVLIEEGIATWIFNHAQHLALFEGITALDYGLLKSVRRFVSGYEAETCPLWLWEKAILQGYEIFRAVRVHRGGRVTIDLDARSIRYDKP